MKLTIPRRELKAAVAGLSKIISNKTTLPILGHVKFVSASDKVAVYGTDLDQQAAYAFADAACDGQGAFTAVFHQLKDLSKGLDGDRIEFVTAGKAHLTVVNPVAGQSVRLDVPTLDVDEWPLQAFAVKTEQMDDFLPTFQRLAPFASTDSTRYVLNACFLDTAEKGAGKSCIVATDGRRLTVCNSMTLPLKDSTIVPTTKFLSWLKGESQIGSVEKNGVQWFGVEAGPWTYMVKTITGTYPNYRQVLPAEAGANKITFAEDISALKQIMKALPDTDGKGAVVMRAGASGLLSVCATGSDDRDVTIEVPGGTFAGKCRQYCLNRYYLTDALSAGFRTFTFADELCPALSDDGHGGRHVIMPMRMASSAEAVASDTTEVKAESSAATEIPAVESCKTVEQPAVTSVPASSNVCHEHIKPKTKGDRMSKQENTAIEKLQAAYEAAKDKVKEASTALTNLAGLIKEALKEEKQRRVEIDNVRATVAKIQSINV